MGRTISGAGARKVQVARSDAGVDIWRRSIDHHNKWKAENPRPSHCRASVAKQAPAPTLMGILLAAMLAGAHVAEARISIASSPRRIANRQAKDPASQPSEGTNVRSATVLRTDQSLATAVMPAGKVTMSELAADALSEAASPTRLNRKTRNTPEDDAQPKVQGDLSLDRKSLIGARVLATSVLLGSAAENKDYKQILEIANAIHRRASDEPDNMEAAEASAMLFREEGLTWARENGADIMGVSDEKALKVFQETWDRVLNPPPPPQFKSHNELKEDAHGTASPFHGKLYIEKQALRSYFNQFYDYMQDHLQDYCKSKVMEFAAEAGLGRFLMEYSPSESWRIDEVLFHKMKNYRSQRLGGMKLAVKEKLVDLDTPAYVLSLPEGNHGIVLPSGAFGILPENNITKNGINSSAVLDALREDVQWHHISSRALRVLLDKRNKDDDFIIKSTFIDNNVYNITIREFMEKKVCTNIREGIENFKSQKYDYTDMEGVLDASIPFFKTFKNSGVDPAHEVKFEDLVWDFVNLGLMIALAQGGNLLRAGHLAASSARGAVRGSTALSTTLQGRKAATQLFKAGRELNHNAMPSLSARQLALASTRTRDPAMGSALVHTLRRSDDLLATAAKSDDTLGAIYKSLANTWWGGKQTPQLIKAEIDAGAAEQIPAVLFRGQGGTEIVSSWGTVGKDRLDDYLAAIIKHSARAGGSAGETFSLTTDRSVALRFIRHKDQGKVLAITTKNDPENFRTIEHILKYDGPRLVEDKRITTGTLAAAIRYALEEGEKEIFYLGGSIPSSWIEVAV